MHPQYGLSAFLRSRGTGRTHHAVGMRHCARSEERKGINTSFPSECVRRFFKIFGGLGHVNVSNVYILATENMPRDSKGR